MQLAPRAATSKAIFTGLYFLRAKI